jgi:hypothetical protein
MDDARIAHGNKPIDENGCQSLYRNLLRMPDSVSSDAATVWIREFMATVPCDEYYDLSTRRKHWQEHLGNDAYEKIMKFDVTDPSLRERAASTLQHYLYYERKVLRQGLDWRNWLGYYCLDRWQMTAAYASLVGGGGAAATWRIAAAAKATGTK